MNCKRNWKRTTNWRVSEEDVILYFKEGNRLIVPNGLWGELGFGISKVKRKPFPNWSIGIELVTVREDSDLLKEFGCNWEEEAKPD